MSTPNSTRGTHPLNASYLVVGLVFLGIAGSWALRQAGVVDVPEMRWLFPLTLVVAGLVGVVAMAAKGLSRSRAEQPGASGYDTSHDVGQDTGYEPVSRHDVTQQDEGEER